MHEMGKEHERKKEKSRTHPQSLPTTSITKKDGTLPITRRENSLQDQQRRVIAFAKYDTR